MEQNPATPWGLSRLGSYAPAGEQPEVTAELDPTSQTTRYRDAADQPVAIDEQRAGRCAAPSTTRPQGQGDGGGYTDDADDIDDIDEVHGDEGSDGGDDYH
ncbi:putative ATP-grasp-modified RiPP [Streptomyces halobius]|uniref:ATP-grasp-modified RiPP n=1 Tax=Streptomyces halobius TaxID=2879846 RepID=A0ABY4M294_9ACTN|nr:putative ATP-grasp-modified RiPP [Streptomyces halobius]